jgi:hypothetical protein
MMVWVFAPKGAFDYEIWQGLSFNGRSRLVKEPILSYFDCPFYQSSKHIQFVEYLLQWLIH